MACKKYIYAAGDTTWVTTFMEAMEKSWKGFQQVTLTDYDTTTACSIEEGSVLEVAGSLYIATSDCAIGTAGISTALQYIQAIGSVGGCVFAYGAVAPTWRDDYQGYYASAASTTRVIGGCYYTRTSFTEKWIYGKPKDMNFTRTSNSLRPLKPILLAIGDWNMDLLLSTSIAHGLTAANIISIGGYVRRDDSAQYWPIAEEDQLFGYWDTTYITLARKDSGRFDSVLFDSTSFNRGWVTIQYEDGT
jgi:hypothetical protein